LSRNFYANLKQKFKKEFTEDCYLDIMINNISSMLKYEYSEIYDNINFNTLEIVKILSGSCGLFYDKDLKKVVGGTAFDGGKRDVNGVGMLITGNTLNGRAYRGINGIDCVYGFNNNLRTPENILYKFAELFTECDVSQYANLLYARLNPVLNVNDSKYINTLTDTLNNNKIGNVSIVNIKNKVTNESGIERVDLNDVKDIDKLQYLSTYHNDLLRRFYTYYGLSLSEGVKQAQQSVNETSSNVASGFVYAFERLENAKKMCEMAVNVFGGEIFVDFSDAWKYKIDEYENNINKKEGEEDEQGTNKDDSTGNN
jgi:hypothetical protein